VRRFRVLSAGAGILALLGTALVASPASAGEGMGGGDPIVVMTIADATQPNGNTTPEFFAAVRARAEAINEDEDGGINGREVKVLSCDTKTNPNDASNCFREAVDAKASAIIGSLVNFDTELYGLMEEAQIPVIGAIPAALDGWQSPVSFPITSGSIGYFYAQPALLNAFGADKMSLLMLDIGPAVSFLESLMKGAASTQGVEYTKFVPIPADATDLSTYVASATDDGENGVVSWIPGEGYNALLRQIQSSGYQGENSTVVSATSPKILGEVGDASNGLLAISGFSAPSAKNPAMKQFRKDMKAFDPDVDLNEVAQQYWASMWIFERVAEGLDTVDGASMIAALNETSDLDMGGMMPNLDFTQPYTDLPQGIPPLARLFNPDVSWLKLKGSKLVPAEKSSLFYNAFSGEAVDI
jgi:ABC-type branched-subunit amino acid transport system substrate-binding protein